MYYNQLKERYSFPRNQIWVQWLMVELTSSYCHKTTCLAEKFGTRETKKRCYTDAHKIDLGYVIKLRNMFQKTKIWRNFNRRWENKIWLSYGMRMFPLILQFLQTSKESCFDIPAVGLEFDSLLTLVSLRTVWATTVFVLWPFF